MAANDWRVTYRNSNDTADTSSQAVGYKANEYAILGHSDVFDASPSWYYFNPTGFSVATAPSGYGSENYRVSIDLSTLNPMDLGNLSDLLDAKGKSYEGTTLRANSFPVFKSATVSSGIAVFNLTNDGTSTGTALFPNGMISDSVNAFVNDATASYQMSYVWSNSNKTLTITTNKLTTANLLSGILGQTAANGAVVKLTVYGY